MSSRRYGEILPAQIQAGREWELPIGTFPVVQGVVNGEYILEV
jgi:hypothetical protein